MNVKHFVQMKTIAFCSCLCRQWHKFKAAGKHALSIQKKEIYSEIYCWTTVWTFEKQNAIIFMKVILVGKPPELLKKVSVLCVCGEGGYVSVCVQVVLLWCGGLRVCKTSIQYYYQSNKRYQVGNIGQFCSTLHHVCAGSVFSDLWAQFGGFREERLGWDNEGLCAHEDS